jgi:hypothetical protein
MADAEAMGVPKLEESLMAMPFILNTPAAAAVVDTAGSAPMVVA